MISLETQLKIALRFKCQMLVGWGGLKSEFEKWRLWTPGLWLTQL